MRGLQSIWLVLKKDVVVELRNREVVATMVLFSILLVVIVAFSLSIDETRARLVGSGIVWIVVLFAGTLGLGRVFEREKENGCLTGLLLSPAGPGAIFIAKVLGLFVFMLITEAITIPLAFVFIGMSIPTEGIWILVLALLLGTIAFAFVGTLFAAMFANARLKDVLLPVVVYPVVSPVLIAGVKLTEISMGVGLESDLEGWLRLMAAFSVLFTAVPTWIFGKVMLD